MKRNRSRRPRFVSEKLERRICLSAVGFVQHDASIGDHGRGRVIAIGDIDGDHDLDLIESLDEGSRRVTSWRENVDGFGSFGPSEVILRDASSTVRLAVDLDGDGDVDLVGASSRKVTWFENLDGQVRFGPERTVVSNDSNAGTELLAADADGDGDIDLVRSRVKVRESRIEVYRNSDGRGNFELAQRIDTRVDSIQLADIDRDGDVDLIGEHENGVKFFENLGGEDGFASIPTSLNIDAGGVVVDDLDGDGNWDILAGNGSFVTWHEQIDSMEFEEVTVLPPQWAGDVVGMRVADVDGDDHLDVLVDYALLDVLATSWFELAGNQSIPRDHAVGESWTMGGDLDGDGRWEVTTRDKIVQLQSDSNTLTEHSLSGPRNGEFERLIAADVNNDGHLDAIVSSYIACPADFDAPHCGLRLAWREQDGNSGRFGPYRSIVDSTAANEVASEPILADIDGDGDLDVLTTDRRHYRAGHIHWRENRDGNGDFSQPHLVPNQQGRLIAVTDWDGDGDLDLIRRRNNSVLWQEHVDGRGTFAEELILAFELSAPDGRLLREDDRIVIHDWDADGDQDLLTLLGHSDDETARNPIVWYENLGNNSVATESKELVARLAADDAMSVVEFLLDDFDNDGDLDILKSGRIDGSHRWYIQPNVDGAGGLGPPVVALEQGFAELGPRADYDGDGDLDLLVSETYRSHIWFENQDGIGAFTRSTPLGLMNAVATGDIDGDGDIDVLSGTIDLIFHENRPVGDVDGNGHFDSSDLVKLFQEGDYERTAPHHRASFETGDWNNDGIFNSADLILALETGSYRG